MKVATGCGLDRKSMSTCHQPVSELDVAGGLAEVLSGWGCPCSWPVMLAATVRAARSAKQSPIA
ncbi:hypothetical protein BHQ23_12565 [Mycobacterium gordonae]|uniref:Uncharacterized protein n=1 Tax=Mycobacterium gordonae TaxID=1778 RepID=A0A1A6BP69_MYCGO|nr:hypothetical protein A9W98_06320 [Mycobacterium gordonae]ODR21413.1 hypothetical protein BHQ23_12565 [Mycobacterium gordonae]ORV95680.1 hypothetical protein AWC08_14525 [Mycobacterium gordonae]